MPRFHLHVRSDVKAQDTEEADFQDLAAAEKSAVLSARPLMSDDIARTGDTSLSHSIEVTDGAGVLLRTVPFRSAVTIRP